MAITKLGQDYIKIANVPLLSLLSKIVTKPVTGVYHALTHPLLRRGAGKAYGASKKVGKIPLEGANKAGKFLVNKPSMAIPILGASAYGAFTINDKIKKNMLHTDPRMNVTRIQKPFHPFNPAPRKGITFHNENYAQAYKKYNPYF